MFWLLFFWLLFSFLSLHPTQAALVGGSTIRIPSFLSSACAVQHESIVFHNVSQWYVEGKLAPISVMKRDPVYQLLNREDGLLYALNLDLSGSYGGYPEDLSQAALELGYDILIVRGNGDDFQAHYLSSFFWRTFKCPVPLFRIGSIHTEQLKSINSTDLFTIYDDPNPSFQFDVGFGAFVFTIQCLLISPALMTLSAMKFRDLFQSGKIWTTGTMLTTVCFLQGLFQLLLGVSNSSSFSPRFRGYSSVVFTVFIFFAATLSILSIYLLAYRFHVVLAETRGIQIPFLQNPWKIAGLVSALMSILLFSLGLW
jgi:hypothetical protein